MAELDGANRYAILYRLDEAKRLGTRARRLAKFIAMLERGEKLHDRRVTLKSMESGDEKQGFRDEKSNATWRDNEDSRRRQLKEDGRRSLSENLAEGLVLSEFLSTFTGAARPR